MRRADPERITDQGNLMKIATESERNEYEETIETYRQLGRKYVQDVKRVTIREFSDFVELLPPGGRVLDVGCAGGRDSQKFAQRGFRVIGIDVVDIFLEEARRNVPGAQFIKMDVLELRFPQNYFDAIWANAVLLHIKKRDILKALKGLCRVLKPGGKLHIRVKRGKGERYKEERLSGGKKRFFSYFFKSELEKLVEESGFQVISSGIFPDELGRKDTKWIGIFAEK